MCIVSAVYEHYDDHWRKAWKDYDPFKEPTIIPNYPKVDPSLPDRVKLLEAWS